MEDRVLREKQAWNEGFNRSKFEAIWAHADAYWADEVDRIIATTFQPYQGGRFLEIGSATWHSWIHRLGVDIGHLDCINISEIEIENGRLAPNETNIRPQFHVMDAHQLDFADNSFDVVFGKAILHHLDYEIALKEIRRVLKPEGVMLFMEPLDFNPLMKLVRYMTPKLRTPDEEPITGKHWRLFERYFDVTLQPLQFFAAAVSPVSQKLFKQEQNIVTRTAWELDKLGRHVPGFRLWYRSGLIIGKKPSVQK